MYCWSTHSPESCCTELGKGRMRKREYLIITSSTSSLDIFVSANLCSVIVSEFMGSCDEGHCSRKLDHIYFYEFLFCFFVCFVLTRFP